MKKLLNVRFMAIVLVMAFALSFVGCSAAQNGLLGDANGEMGGALDEIIGGKPSLAPDRDGALYPNASSPDYGYQSGVMGDANVGTGAEADDEAGEVEGEVDAPDQAEPGDDIDQDVNSPTFIENPFISTATNNISTFSADVDTASYSYFRKLVTYGYSFDQLKNGGSNFRTEEFINYFKYDVAGPREGELFGVHTEMSPCPWNSETMLFRVTLQAEQAEVTGGNNLVFLIDVSGSMSSQDKLPLLKKAFSYLVSNLDADDTVSIVTYSGREAVVLDGCNGLDSTAIMNAINSLKASGSTNGEAGLTMAYQIAEKHFKADGNNRIIMASDGDLNVGISSADQLTSYIEEKRDQGVYLSVLGFGTGNYKDSNMEALADNGNGVYYYIDGETEAEKVFGTDLLGTLYTVAEDVKLQIEFNSDRVESYRLIGYENRLLDKEDFENDAKDAGEVGASHQVTVCYEIKLGQQTPGADTIMTLRVRYKNPGESLSLLNEYKLGDEIINAEPTADTRFIGAVIETCMLLHGSEYADDITLEDILEDLDSLVLEDSYKEEFREIIRNFVK